MATLKPVCRRLPVTVELWEETNLPLSCVVVPLAQPIAKQATNLGNIPKCLHCGAPHPTTTSQYPMQQSLLCHLCGKSSSSGFMDQAKERKAELLYPETYFSKPLPGQSGETLEFSLPVLANQFQTPAISCPPLWWILIQSSTSRKYWNVVAQALQTVIQDCPDHVHVGLAVSSSESMSLWDIRSPVPSVKHYPHKSELKVSFVPMSIYKSHLQAALRALGDMQLLPQGKMPLISTLRALGMTLADCYHPGSLEEGGIPYAGGKVLCVLDGPPEEIGDAATKNEHGFGLGGRGGSCVEPGLKYATQIGGTAEPELVTDDPEVGLVPSGKGAEPKKEKNGDSADYDMTPKGLAALYPSRKKGIEKELANLGSQFAQAAFGVDLLVVSDQHPPEDVGLPLLTPLSERSGAAGPLMFETTDVEGITQEISNRAPWKCSFGGLLRLRMSPGFRVDDSPILPQEEGSGLPELAPLYVNKGLMGAGSATKESGLWEIGSIEPSQTITLDLQVTNKVKRFSRIEGMGEVALKPCMQACFAYTTVVETEEGNYVTVRRIKISTLHMPLASDTESLYSAMDAETLGSVLYHKLVSSVFTEGIAATQDICRNWLKFVMVCAYKSAEVYNELQKDQSEHGLEDKNKQFFASERLLNIPGELSQEEVLLGQGHNALRVLPLLAWSLLQCDALRPGPVPMDARCAAMAQMAGMPPATLARAIAPGIELWNSGKAFEPIVANIDPTMKSLTMHVKEHQQTSEKLLVFFDSPAHMVVLDSRHIVSTSEEATDTSVAGKGLKAVIKTAAESYRSQPKLTYVLGAETLVPVQEILKSMLVGDAVTPTEQLVFSQWKSSCAKLIHEELLDSDY